ncbi:MAG: MMPL family transporter [Planctomycetota bacterium]|nr:MMPL family transporter [Planctomycetota bacterium]
MDPRHGQRARLAALAVSMLAALALFVLPPLEVKASWSGLIRRGEPALEAFERLQTTFGMGERLVMLVEAEPPLAIDTALDLAKALKERPEIAGLAAPVPGVDLPGVQSEDRSKAALYLEIDRAWSSPAKVTALARELRAIPTPEGVRVSMGGSVMEEVALADVVLADQQRIVPLVFLGLMIVIALFLRSVRVALVVAVGLGVTFLITLGAHGLLYGPLTTVTSLLTPIVMTIACANAMHFVARWRRGRRDDGTIRPGTLKSAINTCLLASVTTATGFLALFVMGAPEFDRLAVLGSGGCITAGVVLSALLPVLLPWAEKRPGGTRVPFQGLVDIGIRQVRRRGKMAVLLVLALIVAGTGMTRLETSTVLLDQFPESSDMPRIAQVLAEDLGGIGVADVLWYSPAGFRSEAGLARLREAGKQIEAAIPDVGPVLNAGTAVERMRQEAEVTETAALALYESGGLGKLPRLLDPDGTEARIMVWLPPGSTEGFLTNVRRIEAALGDIAGPEDRVQPSGAPYLISLSTDALVRDQAFACILSILIVSLIAAVVFGSIGVLPLIWVPNLLPLVAMAGLMGWVGEPLSASTAVVGSVVFGLIVDDTLHFLVCLKEARGERQSAARTLARLGPAFLATSVLLVTGAAIAGLGNAGPTALFSRLMAVGVGLALLCDLYLTPRLAARLRLWHAKG